MKKAYTLAEKLLENIDSYSNRYTNEDGKIAHTEASIMMLNGIIEGGFSLYKYLIEKKAYEQIPTLASHLDSLGSYIEKLQVNKQNAEKLHLSDALQVWEQCKIVIAVVCCDLLDYRDSKKDNREDEE